MCYVLIFIYIYDIDVYHYTHLLHRHTHTHKKFVIRKRKWDRSDSGQNIAGTLLSWNCLVYCRASIISGFCLLNGHYCGNQKYTHKFPKCLFRKCITPVENSCSKNWYRTPTRSIGVLPQGFSNWCCLHCENDYGNCQWACPCLHRNAWSAIREIKTDAQRGEATDRARLYWCLPALPFFCWYSSFLL